ncbi:AAA family ATPase [Rhodoferax sp. U11-2br]|uniref:AAA family ATPase n=1 Tax=Rhodoferax sp. U11-2br TaxID=2838878 RepID=UPI001BE9711C|nr:AAA family ATPase [Rhodoferax sp. U11-2br]MBT3066729.1 ATP-binding protein [Rhodoferax sp. U11-2br]
MSNLHMLDPYAGNILTQGLGPILSRMETAKALTELPKRLHSMDGIPPHIAMHHLMAIRDFHIPGVEECRLHQTNDLMIRQNYRYLDPTVAATWATVSGDRVAYSHSRAPAYSGAVVGHSGTGKTEGVLRCLRIYPQQVIQHGSFPRMVGPHKQVVWLSINVPASGRTVDLGTDLMRESDRVTGENRFASELSKERRDGMKMLDSWRQWATSHLLGLLHLDEVQNLFKLATLKKRRTRSGVPSEAPELSIVEDQFLKWILILMNTWHVPLLLSGTPDGIGALTRRLSTTERIVTSGYHVFQHFDSVTDSNYRKNFLEQLGKYQYVQKKLPVDDELANLILELTGGIQRLIVALWIAAHRVALERNDGSLTLNDFRMAAATYLAAVAPAVAAFRSKDPVKMARYEDLLPRNDAMWSQFWGSVSQI